MHEQRPAISSQRDNFYFILSRAIDSTKGDSAQLRKVIYELARAKLQKEAWLRDPPVSILEMRQYLHAFEAAIERIESTSSQEDELQFLLSRVRLIESNDATPKSTAVTIQQGFIDTNDTKAVPIWLRSAERLLPAVQVRRIWLSAEALISMVAAAVIAVALFAFVESHFDFGIFQHEPRRISSIDETASIRQQGPAARNDVSSETERTTPVGTPVLPLPVLYGVYAISDGQLRELELLPIKVPDQKVFISAPITTPSRTTLSDRRASFVVFRRDLMTSAPERVTIRVVARVMRSRTFSSTGKPIITDVDDLWAVRSNSYEFRVAPLSQSPEMIVIRSENDDFSFSAGRYALVLKGQAYDFSVDGPITQAEQCLERTEALNGAVYSECQAP
jgi:hypothetical protein